MRTAFALGYCFGHRHYLCQQYSRALGTVFKTNWRTGMNDNQPMSIRHKFFSSNNNSGVCGQRNGLYFRKVKKCFLKIIVLFNGCSRLLMLLIAIYAVALLFSALVLSKIRAIGIWESFGKTISHGQLW